MSKKRKLFRFAELEAEEDNKDRNGSRTTHDSEDDFHYDEEEHESDKEFIASEDEDMSDDQENVYSSIDQQDVHEELEDAQRHQQEIRERYKFQIRAQKLVSSHQSRPSSSLVIKNSSTSQIRPISKTQPAKQQKTLLKKPLISFNKLFSI